MPALLLDDEAGTGGVQCVRADPTDMDEEDENTWSEPAPLGNSNVAVAMRPCLEGTGVEGGWGSIFPATPVCRPLGSCARCSA